MTKRNAWRRRVGVLLATLGILSLMVAPAVVYGQSDSPTDAIYENPELDVAATGDKSDPSDPPSTLNQEIAGLPFTGLDLMILAGIAVVLTGTGLALRRLAIPREPTV